MDIIAIVSFILSILALPWISPVIDRAIRKIRTRWIVLTRSRSDSIFLVISKATKKGIRSDVQADFMICDWEHNVIANEFGNSQTEINCLLVNLTSENKIGIEFPIYFETGKTPPKGWAKVGHSSFDIIAKWDSNK